MKKIFLLFYILSYFLSNSQSAGNRMRSNEEVVSIKFLNYIGNAQNSYKEDANGAIDKVTKALLLPNLNLQQKALAYAKLGEIQSYWKQYYLAIVNFKESLNNYSK